nr:protein CTLA-2-beta-like [Misgurnus anguillicaudatus]
MNPLDEEWENWKITYNKKYNSPEEETIRRAIWEKTKIFVKAHNQKYEQGLTSSTVGLNQFADQTKEEWCCCTKPRRTQPN